MHDEWLARWRAGRIGFHEGHANAFLERHIARCSKCTQAGIVATERCFAVASEEP